LPLISRNTQRRWIAVSKLKPAIGESGWSLIVVSFLHLQGPARQAGVVAGLP
jgi:sulfur relay (sulfurtransferase) DsrC/TusE family protein